MQIDLPNCFYLFDGCPRTIEEADLLLVNVSIDAVIYLDVPRDVVTDRLKHRFIHEASGRTYSDNCELSKVSGFDDITQEKLIQRIDDQPDAVATRLSIFEDKTLPLLEYFKNLGILYTFSGTDSDTVYSQIKTTISESLNDTKA